jgi:solute carrier family 6 amino acid transporter-like protein 5/7/9/14
MMEEELKELKKPTKVQKTQKWSNDIEFLCSCITLSVGLGNVWRYLTIILCVI